MSFSKTNLFLFAMVIGGVVLAMAADPARGQCQANEQAKLTAPDAAPGDWVGHSVSLWGDWTLIGADRDDNTNGGDAGAAYVFRYDGTQWVFSQKLLAPEGDEGDWFGHRVTIRDEWIVIGAPGDEDNGGHSGSAYVFHYDGAEAEWVFWQKLTPHDGYAGALFGYSVSVWGDAAVIGGFGEGTVPGSAYAFRYDGANWVEERRFPPCDGGTGQNFGQSVSLFGDVAMVADPTHGEGSVSVYRYDGGVWECDQTLTAPSGAPNVHFGFSVSVWDDVAVIGDDEDDDMGWAAGAAYVFRHDGTAWVEEDKLLASDGRSRDHFGNSVSVQGDVVIVAAPQYFGGGFQPGFAHVFMHNNGTWVEQARLSASDAADGDHFGVSPSISGDRAIVGAACDDDWAGEDQGSAYMFHGLSDCNDNGTLDICDIADGTSQDLNSNGIPDECETPSVLLEDLINAVIELNLHQGIENSLDAKLDAASQALKDLNDNNDVAACNALAAFINAVEAQSGKHIAQAEADAIIAAAQEIIAVLNCP